MKNYYFNVKVSTEGKYYHGDKVNKTWEVECYFNTKSFSLGAVNDFQQAFKRGLRLVKKAITKNYWLEVIFYVSDDDKYGKGWQEWFFEGYGDEQSDEALHLLPNTNSNLDECHDMLIVFDNPFGRESEGGIGDF